MKYFSLLISMFALSGCGGGHSNASSLVQPPVTDFQAGIFESSSAFEFACQIPRLGVDPQTGSSYTDYQGSTITENNWLRSWSHELYLWYDEIVDQNPTLYSDSLVYFETLKTLATTPSGNQRDQFHFTFDTDEWVQLSESGVTSGYGMHLSLLRRSPPRDIVVSYVEPGSPADSAGLKRGSKILSVDGVDVVFNNAVDVINDGLFPQDSGESHRFLVHHLGENNDVSVQITSANVTSTPVLKTEVLSTETGKVGYILFNEHLATAESGLVTAIEQLREANVSDLVLDLRYNGGGFLAIAAQLAYMIAGPAFTANKTFELQHFNNQYPLLHPLTNTVIEPIPFLSQTIGFSEPVGQSLPSLDLARVFIITGSGTCSASESVINGLRGINVEVVQIGETTCGKPYGFFPQDNCGTTYFSIQFSGSNDVGFSDYPDGFSPQNTSGFQGELVTGCFVVDDFTQFLGSSIETKLAAALQYRNNGSCPIPATTTSLSGVSNFEKPQLVNFSENVVIPRRLTIRQNKIMGMPN